MRAGNRLKGAQSLINLGGSSNLWLKRGIVRLGRYMGRTSVVHARLAQFHLTGKSVQLLSTVLQLFMQEHKVSLETTLDAKAQCTLLQS